MDKTEERDMTNLDALNEFLDGDSPDDVDLSGISKEEFARHLVVAGVTSHLLAESATATATEDKVRQNMVAVNAHEQPSRHRRNRVFTTVAAAAAVIITTLVYFSEPPSIDPLLERIRVFVLDDLEHEYRGKAETSSLGAEIFAQSMSLTLYVRGRDQYVAEVEFDLFGRQVFSTWMGFDGRDYWIVPPRMEAIQLPVIVSDKSLNRSWKSGELGLSQEFAKPLLHFESAMTVFGLLTDLTANYNVEMVPVTGLSSLPEGHVEIIAYRRPQADITIPDAMRLVVDEDTGVVHRVALKFADLPSRLGVDNPFRAIRYDLVRETVGGEELYQHESHHDTYRDVIRR